MSDPLVTPRITRGYLTTPHGQIHFRECGSGEPLVFLHQTASSSVTWERVFRGFPAGRRLIALDTPGFGQSDPPAVDHPDMAWYAARIAEAIVALDFDGPVDLLGHHTGAMVAAEVAASRPELIGRLLLLGCVVIEDPAQRDDAVAHVNRWQLDAAGDFVARHLIPRLKLSVTTDDPEHMQQELAAYIQAGPDYAKAYDAVWTYDAAARLPLITADTLCAVPEDEPEPMEPWTRRAAELIPGASFRAVPGGTEVAFQQPGVVIDLATQFFGVHAGEPQGAGF